MWSMIEGLPAQYRWAADLDVPPVGSAPSVLVAGMGGSGISGDYAAMVAAASGVDVRVHKDYGLPTWAGSAGVHVVIVSYSGNTAEALDVAEQTAFAGLPATAVTAGGALAGYAAEQGWPLVTVPGGLQPRAALGFLAGAVLRVVGTATAMPDPVPALREASDLTERMLGTAGADSVRAEARGLADRLRGRLVVIWGSRGPTEVAAQRWSKQIHENAKTPAYWSLIPEMNHNELVPWTSSHHGLAESAGIVVLRDGGERDEISARFELTSELTTGFADVVCEVWTRGDTLLARAASASLVGDMVSVYLAEEAGIDPVPVDVLTELKNRL